MKLFNKYIIPFFAVIVLLQFSANATAQCKRYTKKNCLPVLAPFTHNGQLTSAQMAPGESAEISLTFNAGKDYRILVGAQEMIGQVQFKVLDNKRKVLYESDPKDKTTTPYWDFNVAQTQQLYVQINVPKMEKSNQKTNIVPFGCVSVLVGFK